MQNLRDYQLEGSKLIVDTIMGGKRLLLSSPTGSGKSIMFLNAVEELLEINKKVVIVTPSVEIVSDLKRKAIYNNLENIIDKFPIYTPIALRNKLLKGTIDGIEGIIFDEAHHDTAETYEQIKTMCGCPIVGVTATPFRGTPNGTLNLLNGYDGHTNLISWRECYDRGFISFPDIETIPLLDDDIIQISNGELDIRQVKDETLSRIEDFYRTVKERFEINKMASLVSLPDSDSQKALYNLDQSFFEFINAKTPNDLRQKHFNAMLDLSKVLLHINVVTEGVDLPVRLHFDASPTLSPVKFVQRFGRSCRPLKEGEKNGIYICFNRNIQNHSYILSDIMPIAAVKQSQEAFGSLSTRGLYRTVGIKGFGRYKPVEIETLNGTKLLFYYLLDKNSKDSKYGILISPFNSSAIWFKKEGMSKWQRCNQPTQLEGFGSAQNYPLTEKQSAWWNKCCKMVGLNPNQELTSKNFQIMPILLDARISLNV